MSLTVVCIKLKFSFIRIFRLIVLLFVFVCLLAFIVFAFVVFVFKSGKEYYIECPPCFSFARSSLITAFDIWIVISLPFLSFIGMMS